MAAVFTVLCLVNALTMGSLLQVNAMAGAMETGFSVPPPLTGCGVAVLAAAAALGGAKRIAALTEKLVPIMTVGFLVVCLSVLILRRERIPAALASVWEDAFTIKSAGAGIVGFLTSRGIRYGVMRGLVSNEAGCGTAPMAHATARTDLPARQGLFGLVEVFVDTGAAFSSVLGDWAEGFFALSILLFGVATVICWAHYGMTCVGYLFRRDRTKRIAEGIYTVGLAASLAVGAVTAPTLAWTVADAAIAVMTILNLLLLVLLRSEVKTETSILLSSVPRRGRRISCKEKQSERSQP